ncbi:hypothetical protein [Catellatospora sichuanensis]|uniref:hypothetical protein n=1 Tax=Catellatospora sichuanensis TaxID=1969805 RepID=UPI001181F646|nr:hypothetical protein [Catellatospora sichuanensis]
MPIDGRSVSRRSGRGIRYAALAACAPLLVAVLTACGPGGSETTGEADAGTAGLWDAYDKQKQNLATCLNEKGLAEVRYLGHDNLMEFSGLPEGDLTPDLIACFEKWPALDRPVQDTPAKPTEEQLREGREIAKCMRENGVPDWPDPDPHPGPIDGATARREKQEHKAKMQQPVVKAASKICMPWSSDVLGNG